MEEKYEIDEYTKGINFIYSILQEAPCVFQTLPTFLYVSKLRFKVSHNLLLVFNKKIKIYLSNIPLIYFLPLGSPIISIL